MTMNDVLYLAREAVMTALIVGGPILGISLIVGLIISVFQAMTQIQEQTLTFVPKIVGIALVLLLLGPLMLSVLTSYTINLFTDLANLATR